MNTNTEKSPFADLEDPDFENAATESAPARPLPSDPLETYRGATGAKPDGGTYACEKCKGSGVVQFGYINRQVGKCHRCNGRGYFKTSQLQRKREKELRRNRKVAAVEKWHAENPEVSAWLKESAPRFEFAASLLEAVAKYGSLTDRQLASAQKCVEKAKARAAERAKPRDADANIGGAAKLLEAFHAALASGLKNPKLRIGSLMFTIAKPDSKNPGCLYVKDAGEYIGKITPAGELFTVRSASAESVAAIESIGSDPLAAAVVHGQKTGNCACCGRELTNAESVELGIGPICAEKWGF